MTSYYSKSTNLNKLSIIKLLFFIIIITFILYFIFTPDEYRRFQKASNAFIDSYIGVDTKWGENKENFELHSKILELENQIKVFNDGEKLSNNYICEKYKCHNVEISGSDNLQFPVEIKVNIGKNSGVQRGNVVIYGTQLVGVVNSVSDIAATISTIYNTNVKLSVKSQSSNAVGIVDYDSNTDLVLFPLSKEDKFVEDEIVYTKSTNDPVYIGDIAVGRVKLLGEKNIIEPILDFRYIDSLLIVMVTKFDEEK